MRLVLLPPEHRPMIERSWPSWLSVASFKESGGTGQRGSKCCSMFSYNPPQTLSSKLNRTCFLRSLPRSFFLATAGSLEVCDGDMTYMKSKKIKQPFEFNYQGIWGKENDKISKILMLEVQNRRFSKSINFQVTFFRSRRGNEEKRWTRWFR